MQLPLPRHSPSVGGQFTITPIRGVMRFVPRAQRCDIGVGAFGEFARKHQHAQAAIVLVPTHWRSKQAVIIRTPQFTARVADYAMFIPHYQPVWLAR